MEEEPDIAYWPPRVMRHRANDGMVEYAIHEVYFDRQHRPVTWTQEAVSPRLHSPAALKEWIAERLAAPDEGVTCGDLGYTHNHGSFASWLEYVDEPPIDYDRS